jgi:serine/threonine-protein kinase
MEVLEAKSKPLDLEGVPEPLAALIGKMTDPDPGKRFQTSRELLSAISPQAAAPEPKPAQRTAKAEVEEDRPKKTMALPIAAGVLILALGGGYFSGAFDFLLGPSYPNVDPYTLSAEKNEDGTVRITGHAPSEEAKSAFESIGPASITLAAGGISDAWPGAVVEVLGKLSDLDEYSLKITGNEFELLGLAPTRSSRDAMLRDFDQSGIPAPLTGKVDILAGPRFLMPADLDPVLNEAADCGGLTLTERPEFGFPLGATVAVTGAVASGDTRSALFDALNGAAGDRTIVVDTDVLNASLCLIDSKLPDAPSGGFEVTFGYGATGEPNPDGAYAAGENPTIDIDVPEGVAAGHIWVSIVDVTGNVYHLLPNINRDDTNLAQIAQDGRIRVAWSLAERDEDPKRIAFVVDETFGKSKVLVMHSVGPFFEDIRPTTESAESFAKALEQRITSGGARVSSLDVRLIETR